ncbi:Sec-independent protein translocase protein TatB [Rhodanobacter ginsengiterrae]|uniref:Sec-independent protein translocase protein TatB n=1 Tax=Rhodanobacter ginsengiterrae TaxID=2008451 RepID=UPI003CF76640
MIEISFGKLVLLALIALIVLGPEKLPGAARTAGALVRRMRSGWDNVRAEVERELQIEEIKRTAREAAARAEAAQAELDVAVHKVRNFGSELPHGEATRVDAEDPAVMRPLADARTSDREVPAAAEDSRTGDLFAPAKTPAEPPHGNA